MDRFAQLLASALLLASAALLVACNSASGVTTGSTPLAPDLPVAITNEDPLARPVAVAWTSARAQRCGFYFDATKLRASYLAYEGKQSPEGLAKAQQTYDSTFNTIRDRISSTPDYCTERKSAEIKGELQRHLAGDFTPKLPQPKKVETCGMWGCPPDKSDEPFDAKKMYDDIERRQGTRG